MDFAVGSVSLRSPTVTVALVFVSIVLYLALSRLVFHPLAKVPGPKVVALTEWYEVIFECFLGGKYAFEVERMHQKYGPIVRISPREVHISDPSFFDRLYNVSGKLDKDNRFYRAFGSEESIAGSENVELHRVRRKAVSRFFSPSAISNLERPIRRNIQKFCRRIEESRLTKTPVNLSNAFRCFAADTASQYCMPNGYDLLDSIDFADDYNKQARSLSYIFVWNRYFPIIVPVFMLMPRWFIKLTSTSGGLQAFDYQQNLARQMNDIVHSKEKSNDTVLEGAFHSDLPASDKTAARLIQEARTIIGAGTETTGGTLDHIFFNVLSYPDVLSRLKNELSEAAHERDLLSYRDLQELPYLTAVINETLRTANAVSGRLPRLDPTSTMTYGGYELPPGTSVSMNIKYNHMDSQVYSQPLEFHPDRWLVSPEQRKALEAQFTPFSRGSRNCIGKELAMMELYMVTANVMHQFDFKLFETTKKDIEMVHDFFAPWPYNGSRGVQVQVV